MTNGIMYIRNEKKRRTNDYEKIPKKLTSAKKQKKRVKTA